jgi:hypothetical protein
VVVTEDKWVAATEDKWAEWAAATEEAMVEVEATEDFISIFLGFKYKYLIF